MDAAPKSESKPDRLDWRMVLVAGAIFTVIGEALALGARFGLGVSAEDFNKSARLLLQVHHMFWAIPLVVVAGVARAWPRVVSWLSALALACVASDLIHHFVVMPILAGETAWHWP
jgi:thiosulfate reductase cytochrome b subunit